MFHTGPLRLVGYTFLLYAFHELKKDSRKIVEVYRKSAKIILIFLDIQGFLEGDDWVENGGEKCEMIGYRHFIE